MPSKDMGILNTSSKQSLRLFWLTDHVTFLSPWESLICFNFNMWYYIVHDYTTWLPVADMYIIHLICIPSRFLGMSIINLQTVPNPLLEVGLCCRSSHILFHLFDGGHLYECQPVCITSQSQTWVNHPSSQVKSHSGQVGPSHHSLGKEMESDRCWFWHDFDTIADIYLLGPCILEVLDYCTYCT